VETFLANHEIKKEANQCLYKMLFTRMNVSDKSSNTHLSKIILEKSIIKIIIRCDVVRGDGMVRKINHSFKK
jgi:hypothetical protein